LRDLKLGGKGKVVKRDEKNKTVERGGVEKLKNKKRICGKKGRKTVQWGPQILGVKDCNTLRNPEGMRNVKSLRN